MEDKNVEPESYTPEEAEEFGAFEETALGDDVYDEDELDGNE